MSRRRTDAEAAEVAFMAVAVGARLKALRVARTLTQSDLGERVGVTGFTLGQWERGVVLPNLATLYRLAAALGVTPLKLLPKPEVLPPRG